MGDEIDVAVLDFAALRKRIAELEAAVKEADDELFASLLQGAVASDGVVDDLNIGQWESLCERFVASGRLRQIGPHRFEIVKGGA